MKEKKYDQKTIDCLSTIQHNAKATAYAINNILHSTALPEFQEELSNELPASGQIVNRFAETVKKICRSKRSGKTDSEKVEKYHQSQQRLQGSGLNTDFEEMCEKILKK